jgi:hypothetical protein
MVRKAADHVHCECISGLEDEIRVLKRRLAAQATQAPASTGRRKHGGDDDWLDDLAEQDRRFMEKRLGMR